MWRQGLCLRWWERSNCKIENFNLFLCSNIGQCPQSKNYDHQCFKHEQSIVKNWKKLYETHEKKLYFSNKFHYCCKNRLLIYCSWLSKAIKTATYSHCANIFHVIEQLGNGVFILSKIESSIYTNSLSCVPYWHFRGICANSVWRLINQPANANLPLKNSTFVHRISCFS